MFLYVSVFFICYWTCNDLCLCVNHYIDAMYMQAYWMYFCMYVCICILGVFTKVCVLKEVSLQYFCLVNHHCNSNWSLPVLGESYWGGEMIDPILFKEDQWCNKFFGHMEIRGLITWGKASKYRDSIPHGAWTVKSDKHFLNTNHHDSLARTLAWT